MVRAKFKVYEKTEYETGGKVILQAVTSGSEENDKFFKYTPSGKIELAIVSQEALEMFDAGAEYYVDFMQVEKA